MLVLLFLSVAGAQLAANDLCVGALNVTDGQHVGNNYGVPVPAYSQRYDCVYESDVYYVYQATCAGEVTFSAVADHIYYLYLATFPGNCAGLGPCVAAYSSGTTPGTLTTYSSAIGEKLYFAIGTYYTDSPDSFQFNITCTPHAVAAGDTCPHAIPYTAPFIVVNTTNAFPQRQSGGSNCDGPDIFILYNATCDGDATVSSTTSGYNRIAVFYPGNCNQIVGSDWQRSCETDGDVTFPVRANQLYYVAVGGSVEYDYNVSFTCAAVTRPANDECQGALTVASPFTFDTSTATRSVPTDACASFDNDVWIAYTATCSGDVWLQFNGSAYAVAYSGSSCDGVLASDCLDSDDTLSFPVLTGQTYRIALASYYGQVLEANFTCVAQTRPTNDKCVNATATGTNTSYVFDPRAATAESRVRTLSCDRTLVHDIWFQYTTCVGTNTISVTAYNGSLSGVALAAYLGCGLEPVACSGSVAAFGAPAPVPVLIGVGFGAPAGFAQVDFSCVPFAPTDAPTPFPTAPTTAQPTPLPTAPTAPTTAQPTTATPTTAAPTTKTPTGAPTDAENTTDTSAPTLSGAETLQLGLASLLGFAILA